MLNKGIQYLQTAKLLPSGKSVHMLDLGCCTDLEYEEFLNVNPDLEVTGIAEQEKLMTLLKEKSGKRIENLRLIYGNFWDADLGNSRYDVVISAALLKQYSRKQRIYLYRKVCKSLTRKGVYIQSNYEAGQFERETDMAAIISEQIALFLEAGFQTVEKVICSRNITILKAIKY